MQITVTKVRWRRILTVVATILTIIVPIIVGIIRQWRPQIWFVMSAFMGMVTPLALSMHIKVTNWWGLLFEQGTLAFFGIYLLHLNVLEGRFLTPVAFVCNGMISLTILFICQAIFASPRKTGLVYITFCWLYGLLNTFIYQFRGCVIILNDLHSLQTAMNVAANYKPEITPPMFVSTYVYICVMANIIRSSTEIPSLKGRKARLTAVLLAVIMMIYPLVRLQVTPAQIWGRNGPRKNGTFMEFVCELNSLSIKEPDNYSEAAISEIINPYSEDNDADALVAEEEKPHIIIVMSESYSDLSVLGVETNREVAPNFREISESTLHGQLLASVYGGNTANSEWELLTGNSMAFMPGGSVPYRQYADEECIYSLVEILKEQNYECVAMHPYLSNGWDRTKVYPAMGFDRMLFLEDMDWGEKVRDYISDEAFTNQLINCFENRDPDKQLFIFGITMQNHGSYSDESFVSEISIEGLTREYPRAEQYLGLVHVTDESIRQMVDYFEAVDEKVLILFFGDHQPRLEPELYDELALSNEQLKQVVPFFVWSNYEQLSGEIPLMSINGLSPMLLDIAGLDMPDYFKFILDFQKTVPALNPLGYFYNGQMRSIEDIDPAVEEIMNDYNILQYANVFDKEMDDTPFTELECTGN